MQRRLSSVGLGFLRNRPPVGPWAHGLGMASTKQSSLSPSTGLSSQKRGPLPGGGCAGHRGGCAEDGSEVLDVIFDADPVDRQPPFVEQHLQEHREDLPRGGLVVDIQEVHREPEARDVRVEDRAGGGDVAPCLNAVARDLGCRLGRSVREQVALALTHSLEERYHLLDEIDGLNGASAVRAVAARKHHERRVDRIRHQRLHPLGL
mmetsp:Transcript_61619/g.146737  ORF Transcript_61619/g.146737 Transcript_61619/m.146737 type:complete len:206 (-) Transcript_61619:995-1612(-)